ncbi:ferrichrome transporter ATP-binding protein [Gluconacetobacter sacchari DSM 12717]|uniref:ATP-binding cassette domain-containing protein n=2 Tax=Gluconacetobacter sacchari TaxID=92759 RepID=A0A7W4IG64_9PROT|nr:ATP-binding cassette domain-containing protein [Gluconacetobacter sacchari]MBB2162288.1 ATP-binding cassette domain-containing protein [Gluconacetobacter sacchari]GBQ20344.1 ferrichrome transporter ATP-binding protein [Gluconacetobacter sacchari DSM 12717]
MSLRLRRAGFHVAARSIVAALDLETRPGEVLAIVGPNGAGKSTALRLLAGIVGATTGVVTSDGRPIADVPRHILARRRALLPQDGSLRARFTVRELATMGLAVAGAGLTAPRQARIVDAALARTGLSAFARRDVMTLSGGERQRAHLARVLAQLEAGAVRDGPGILLLDEPIAAQDLARQKLVLDLACDHARMGGSVVVVLHDLNWAAARADRIVVMKRGQIHAQGPPDQLLNAALLADVFGVRTVPAPPHAPTGRPYILPHDLLD